LSLGIGSAALAQTNGNTNNGTPTTQQSDDSGKWGLARVLGLAGLAGLARRHRRADDRPALDTAPPLTAWQPHASLRAAPSRSKGAARPSHEEADPTMFIWWKRPGQPARRRVIWWPLLLSLAASVILTILLNAAR
jgi:hypothetical protein